LYLKLLITRKTWNISENSSEIKKTGIPLLQEASVEEATKRSIRKAFDRKNRSVKVNNGPHELHTL